jgi:uncharacterized membrane protein YccC
MRHHVNGTPGIRLSLRSALGLTVPLLLGVISGQRLDSIVVSLGALWAISQDGLDEWTVRGPRILLVGVTASLGIGLGAIFASHGSSVAATACLFGTAAIVGGVLETSKWPSSGVYLLVGTIVGDGLAFGGRVWQSVLLVAAGAGWVYLLGALTDRRKRLLNQRVFLGDAFSALADLLDTVATPRFYEERAKAVAVVDTAHDVVGGGRLRGGGEEEIALRQCLIVALRFGEVIAYLEAKHQPVDPAVSDFVRSIADLLRQGTGREATERLSELPGRFAASAQLDTRLVGALVLPSADEVRAAATREHHHSTRARLPVAERLRFAAILGVAVVCATVVAHVLNGPHGFWLPLSVAFILRPDVGPVISRALARTVGTAIGVAIAVAVSWTGNSVVALIVLSCAMAATMPWATRRSHLLAVVTFTPIVFVLIGLVGNESSLFVARIVDTAIGAAIVLLVDLVVWSRAPSLRPEQQLARAIRAAERYEKDAANDSAIQRNALRRDALRAVGDARHALALAAAEPAAFRRPSPMMSDELDRVEAALDDHTVRLLEGRDTKP